VFHVSQVVVCNNDLMIGLRLVSSNPEVLFSFFYPFPTYLPTVSAYSCPLYLTYGLILRPDGKSIHYEAGTRASGTSITL
jgi:hypothetical protein